MFKILNIHYLVPQTVPTKVPFLQDELESSCYITISLTGTWLEDAHGEGEPHTPGYTFLDKTERVVPSQKLNAAAMEWQIMFGTTMSYPLEICFEFSNGVIEYLGVTLRSLNLGIVVTHCSLDNKPNNRDGTHKSESKW